MALPIGVQQLPALNAALNATAFVLLTCGYLQIRRGRRRAHTACMIGALVVSALFLASYVTYHTLKQRATGSAHTTYEAAGAIRTLYLAILLSHVVLAIVIVPMVARTVYLAARRRFDRHRLAGRRTLPLWMYVSITGVVVYIMLYHLQPSAS